MLSIAVGTVAVLAIQTSTGLGTRLDNATQAQTGMTAVSKVLRTAVLPTQLGNEACAGCPETALVTATPSRVSFYANLDNNLDVALGAVGTGPSLVTIEVVRDPYSVSSGVLEVTTRLPMGGTNTRVVTRGLDWPATAVFAYYDFDGLLIPSSALAGSLARVTSVDVSLTVQTIPGQPGVPTHSAVQRVRLPNAEATVLEGPS
jgi:hypothetical protein